MLNSDLTDFVISGFKFGLFLGVIGYFTVWVYSQIIHFFKAISK